MGQHDQCYVAVRSTPEAADLVVQPQFPFGVLVESFDYPSAVGHGHQVMEREGVQAPGEEVFGFSLMTWPGCSPISHPLVGRCLPC